MKSERRLLINDLLDDAGGEARRSATLTAGARILRHKRRRRAATRVFLVVGVIALAAISLHFATTPHGRTVSAVPKPIPKVHYLTDDQLLALFPNTPVGLATVGGRKVLIFPRLDDRERFVGSF
jgi:hypothetical protein